MKKRSFHYKKVLGISLALALFLGGIGIVQNILDERTKSFEDETVVKVDENKTQETKKEEEKAPVDLAGTWKSEDNDGSWMEAVIADDTITVNWVSDNGDTTSIYWVGTYTAPTEYSADYTWTSDRNKEQTDNAMLASTDDTKDFSYSDADKELSYQVSMAGTTTKVKLTKAE